MFHASVTIGVSGSVGFGSFGGSASVEGTTGFELGSEQSTSRSKEASQSSSRHGEVSIERTREFAASQSRELANTWNRDFSAKTERTVEVTCYEVTGADIQKNLYAFTLETDAGFDAVMGEGWQMCTYGVSKVPEPVCLLSDCDNAFATNCQKCKVGSIGQIFNQAPTKARPKHTGEALDFGSFVEFEGDWQWQETPQTGTSYLVLYNGGETQEYTLCDFDRFAGDTAPQCGRYQGERYQGDYTPKPRGAELELYNVFVQGSLIRFTRLGNGSIEAKFRENGRNASVASATPDGTATFTHVDHLGTFASN